MTERVNKDNWLELQAQGFECLTTVGTSGDHETEESTSRYINDLRNEHGEQNVMVGDTLNATGVPDAELSNREQIVGIYVNKRR